MVGQIIALSIFASGTCISLSPTELYISEFEVFIHDGFRGWLLTQISSAGLWWCPLAFDTIVFVLTTVRLYSLRKALYQNHSLFHVLLRDGLSYYIIICLVYVMNTINWMSIPGLTKIAGLNFGLAIPAIAICRLTLNLQGIHSESEDNDNLQTTSFTGDTDLGVLTSAHSILHHRLADGAVWLTGERWDSIYLGNPTVEERELHILADQTSTSHK
ncbi:hypothetical protein Clacol_009952 [Clathrus columnatus]|uniref:Transmembrane protein n=1 Tax=Clathrus columnatus TaxID=1419009 RepID=A0AAV5AM36_9AGAM|nr:hypothetical protein Clacol_009952 [Clathrus columnatus]